MSIFNSLGSNYTFENVIETFSASDKETNKSQLKKFLEEKYGGSAMLVYKGREALRLAFKAVAFKDATVGICGFTCFAVYDAVVKEGLNVEYLDIDDSLNFSVETVKKAVQNNPKLKIVIAQNTLGYPCDIEKIAKFCKEKNIILIEDLAHSIGATYSNGKEAGTVGDFVILSFSQDKMIDGISGGALIVRNTKFTIPKVELKQKDAKMQQKDRQYPLFTFLIRKTYSLGIGKIVHVILKRKKLLTQPMDNLDSKDIFELPNWYSEIIYSEYHQLEKNLAHRKKISQIYVEALDKTILKHFFVKAYKNAANLRFPIFVQKRDLLIKYLKEKDIYVSDIWYDAAIGPKKYLAKTDYNGQCPIADKLSEEIVNLPTHKNISSNQAKILAKYINEWLTKQKI